MGLQTNFDLAKFLPEILDLDMDDAGFADEDDLEALPPGYRFTVVRDRDTGERVGRLTRRGRLVQTLRDWDDQDVWIAAWNHHWAS
jgi:hypothetical protein